ncbi:MAG TPA: hypothetical protein DCK76_00380 [Desulfotomaculum sp.]|nr:MAG: hypothetical protein XD84_1246 [Desulfotomaculum sp. 46_80]KUK85145.1 MAG: hypothetical protein XE00_0330 [Desulfofundulus kuznetsovii]HAG09877.1 hypothetical protein [Desulfotomaculum sp.]HBY04585.1 hypothetical protein [Desulfotomaculum sp.]
MSNKRHKLILKMCILERYKLCDNCCECFICCLDDQKVCDNCGLCLEAPDYGIFFTGVSPITEETKK